MPGRKLLCKDDVDRSLWKYINFDNQKVMRLSGGERICVEATCPICKRKIWKSASGLRFKRIMIRCIDCRSRLAPLSIEDIPERFRDLVDLESQGVRNGHRSKKQRSTYIVVRCRDCGKPREVTPYDLKNIGEYCSHCRPKRRNNQGAANYNWKGGRRIGKNGYVDLSLTLIPEEDYKLLPSHDIEHRQTREHRYIMAKHLGRLLQPEEFVKHLNGNKSDNRIENLEIGTGPENTIEHYEAVRLSKQLYGQVEMLERYIRQLGHDPSEAYRLTVIA